MNSEKLTEESAYEAAEWELSEEYTRKVGSPGEIQADLVALDKAAQCVIEGDMKPLERLSLGRICKCLAFSSAFDYSFEDEAGELVEDTDLFINVIKDHEIACRALEKFLLNAAARAKTICAQVYGELISILTDFHFLDKTSDTVFDTPELASAFEGRMVSALRKLWAENAVFVNIHSVHTQHPPYLKKG